MASVTMTFQYNKNGIVFAPYVNVVKNINFLVTSILGKGSLSQIFETK